MSEIRLELPFTDQEEILRLRIGDMVSLSGTMYSARDAAHKRMFEYINN